MIWSTIELTSAEDISFKFPLSFFKGDLTAIIYSFSYTYTTSNYAPAPYNDFKTPPDEFNICKFTTDLS